MPERVIIGLAGLLAFGWVYDQLIHWVIIDVGWKDFTAWQVIGGTLATLFGVWLMVGPDQRLTGNEWVVLTLLGFAASGLPMTIGSWRRRVTG